MCGFPFLRVLLLSLTLDGGLFGSRAEDNQVKSLIFREADKDGHTADSVACALYRVVFGLRF